MLVYAKNNLTPLYVIIVISLLLGAVSAFFHDVAMPNALGSIAWSLFTVYYIIYYVNREYYGITATAVALLVYIASIMTWSFYVAPKNIFEAEGVKYFVSERIYTFNGGILYALLYGFVAKFGLNFIGKQLQKDKNNHAKQVALCISSYLIFVIIGFAMSAFLMAVLGYMAILLRAIMVDISQYYYLGTFLFGFSQKIFLLLGLEHLVIFPVHYDFVGGSLNAADKTITGAVNIFEFQRLYGGDLFYTTRFLLQGNMLSNIFIIPTMLWLAYSRIYTEDSKARILLLLVAIMAFVLGNDLAFEIMLFICFPLVYIYYALLCGFIYLALDFLQVYVGGVGMSGFFSFIYYGFMQAYKTNAYVLISLGMVISIVNYWVLSKVVDKFRAKSNTK